LSVMEDKNPNPKKPRLSIKIFFAYTFLGAAILSFFLKHPEVLALVAGIVLVVLVETEANNRSNL
jgi:hypothetical protein